MVHLNDLGQIGQAFGKILNQDFFVAIATEDDGMRFGNRTPMPIIQDLEATKRSLARLFAVRHILTHECPEQSPYEPTDVPTFLTAAGAFVQATEHTLSAHMDPHHGRTTLEMITAESESLVAAQAEMMATLHRLSERIADGPDPHLLRRAQEAWTAYVERQAELRSSTVRGGALEPLILGRSPGSAGEAADVLHLRGYFRERLPFVSR